MFLHLSVCPQGVREGVMMLLPVMDSTFPPGHHPPHPDSTSPMVNKRAVRILPECFLVECKFRIFQNQFSLKPREIEYSWAGGV